MSCKGGKGPCLVFWSTCVTVKQDLTLHQPGWIPSSFLLFPAPEAVWIQHDGFDLWGENQGILLVSSVGEGVSTCEQSQQKLLNVVVWFNWSSFTWMPWQAWQALGAVLVWASALVLGQAREQLRESTLAGLVLSVLGVSALLTDQGWWKLWLF